MLPADLVLRGEHTMTVCNACRYCEAYCPVFPAMEARRVFAVADLTYLANLCHNCGECLYACQYAPPHEFGINVPRTMAEIRLASYEEFCWPRPFAVAYRRHGLVASFAFILSAVALVAATSPRGIMDASGGDFYRVLPHDVMVGIFGAAFLLVMTALVVGTRRFWRQMESGAEPITPRVLLSALKDAATLRHLHGGDKALNCADAEETRSPWRRWFHHCTMYGYLLCFASTAVAAIYHVGFHWVAPYAYASLPVVLGTAGGVGLVVGPAGLLAMRHRRDAALNDPRQQQLDTTFIALLLLTSLTGLLLLVMRDHAAMGILVVVHLAFVLTLFVTMPYSKFVHGIFRTAALVRFALETSRNKAGTGHADRQ